MQNDALSEEGRRYVGPQISCKPSLGFSDAAWGGASPPLCISIHPVEGASASPTPTGSKGAGVLLELLLTTSICNGHQDAIAVLSSGGTSTSDCLPEEPSNVVLRKKGHTIDQLEEEPDVDHVILAVPCLQVGWVSGSWGGTR